MATTDVYSVSGSLTPTKPAIRFLGDNVDDGVQVDAAVAAIVAGNHTIGTFTAWIMVADNTGTYTIFGAGNSAAVEYMHVSVEAGTIWVMMVDTGPTTKIDVNTAANTIKPNVWHHVAVVQDASSGMKIYIDGVDMPLTWTTETTRTQWVADFDTMNGGHIGTADSIAGGGLLTQEFKGYIGDVRLYSGTTSASALSQTQVQRVMSGQSVNSPFGWWTLDRSVADKGSGANNGTIVGAIVYVDANEFVSKLTFTSYVLITATNISLLANGGMGFAVFVPSA